MEFNKLVNQIKDLRKAKQDATEQQEASKAMKGGIKELEEKEKELSEARDATLLPIGNLVHDTVPISDNEVRGRSLCASDCCSPAFLHKNGGTPAIVLKVSNLDILFSF